MQGKLIRLNPLGVHMQCPVCGASLTEQTRHEIVLALCPEGHGAWFSKGALEEVVRRNEEDFRLAGQVRQPGSPNMKHARRDEDWVDYYPEEAAKLPKPFLSELFEK